MRVAAMPLARRSNSAQVKRRSPWTCACASGICSAMTSQTSAKFQPGIGGPFCVVRVRGRRPEGDRRSAGGSPAPRDADERGVAGRAAGGGPDQAGARRRAVDFALPPDDDPRRIEIRRWLAEHPSPTGRELAEAGLVAPHWPRPWGLDADPIHQLIIDDELRRA